MTFLGIDGDTRIIAHSFVCTGCEIEQRCFPAVRVSHQGYIDGSALLHGNSTDLSFCFTLDVVAIVIRNGSLVIVFSWFLRSGLFK